MKRFTFKGKNIQYRLLGNSDSPCLVFLHGYLENLSMWDKFHYLSEKYCLLLIDLPGHGSSDTIYQKHSMPLQAHIVQQILQYEHINNATIIGHSMGGYIALAMANFYPEYCKEIVLFHSHPYADNSAKLRQREVALSVVQKDKDRYCRLLIPNLFFHQKEHRLEILSLIQNALNMTKEGIEAAIRGMIARKDYTNFVQSTTIPISFIVGKHDSLIPDFDKMELQFPDNKFYLLQEAGHMSHIEDWNNCKIALEKILY